MQLLTFTLIAKLIYILHVRSDAIVSGEETGLSGQIWDVTKPIKTFLTAGEGNASRQDLISELGLGPPLKVGENKSAIVPAYFFYEADCKITNPSACSEEIADVARLLTRTLDENRIFDLRISLTVDLNTIQQLIGAQNRTKIQLPLHPPISILVNLDNEINCADLTTANMTTSDWEKLVTLESWISVLGKTKYGFGYPEPLIGCTEIVTAVNVVHFVVLNLKFGDTVGVTESFGLFQKRMNFLHEQNSEFLKEAMYYTMDHLPETIYYPIRSSVGEDEEHKHLLITFAQKWATKVKNVIIQILNVTRGGQETSGKSMLIAHIPGNNCKSYNTNADYEFRKWFVPSALETISTHFQSTVLTYGKLEKEIIKIF
ncbi:unnamed protein product [Orchesella dallaii]|uniref:Uncharacterized protein n=1 Tax=Orchesella dallaii TaxID=48710 RepID=A0ABP1RBB9_9HEXA